MKSIFESAACTEMIRRIEALPATAERQWGTMNPPHMLEHASRVVEMAMGRGTQKQMFLGTLIAWAFKSKFVGADPFDRNSPTGPDFVIKDEPEFASAKARLIGLVRQLHAMGESGCDGHIHRFFGRLSGAEWGVTQHKHLDHHLRQFGQ